MNKLFLNPITHNQYTLFITKDTYKVEDENGNEIKVRLLYKIESIDEQKDINEVELIIVLDPSNLPQSLVNDIYDGWGMLTTGEEPPIGIDDLIDNGYFAKIVSSHEQKTHDGCLEWISDTDFNMPLYIDNIEHYLYNGHNACGDTGFSFIKGIGN